MADETNQKPMGIQELMDRELTRLHSVIASGKEVAWATAEVTRILQVMIHPPVMISESFSVPKVSR